MGNAGIDAYCKEIGEEPLLSMEEEQELAKRIEQGDQEARKKFAKANLRLVISIANRYRYNGRDFEDLIQDGNIGLMRAVDKFDWRRGCKFSTYATWWVEQSISRELNEHNRTIYLPGHCQKRIRKIRRVKSEYQDKEGRWPTLEELAKQLHLPVKKIRLMERDSRDIFSLDQVINNDGGKTLLDFCAGQDETRDEMRIEEKEQREALEKAMNEVLDDRQKLIFKLRTGLIKGNRSRILYLREIGNILGISGERVRQIQNKAIGKLITYFIKKGMPRPLIPAEEIQ